MKKKSESKKPTKKSKKKQTKTARKKKEETAKKIKAKKPTKAPKKTKKTAKKTLKKTEKKKTKGKEPTKKKAVSRKTKEIALPKKKVAAIPARTLKSVGGRAEISAPAEAKKAYPAAKLERGLPSEYGENRITLMTVDPWKLFAYWEVRPETLSKTKGTLVLRVYDVTGIFFDGTNANIVFDIAVHERIGNNYIGVGPDREFIVDIGVATRTGEFITIARSNKVATPVVRSVKEEGILPQEVYEPEHVVGYF